MFKFIKNTLFKPGPQYSWKKVITLLFFSSLVFSGGGVLSFLFYQDVKQKRAVDRGCAVQAIVQTGPQYTPLLSRHLAELLDLSENCAPPLIHFDLEEAKDKLMECSAIKSVQLKKIKPNTLFIHYSTREPIAYLEDFTNTAVDAEGFLFATLPESGRAQLPSIYLGESAPTKPWKFSLQASYVQMITHIFDFLGASQISRIDLSKIEAPSFGEKELVVVLADQTLLRLTPKSYVQQLKNYIILEKTYLNQEQAPYIIDLRLSEVAYISSQKLNPL